MNWAWATSLDQIWHSPEFPMWLTLAAAGFFGLVVLITLLRAEKSVANGALTVITLLAIGVAVAAILRGFSPATGGRTAAAEPRSPPQINATLPALSCIDDMAGEAVLTACEKALFGSAESAAAAVSYAASRLTRLTAFGDVAAADRNMTPELQALRHSVERDRYGLAAYVLLTRDHCTPSDCAAFRSLTDHNQIVANMDERIYEGLVTRYAASWNAPVAAVGSVAALPSSMPTGRPTNAEFPSAASIPPVSIMNPEPGQPGAPAARAPAAAAAAANTPRPAPSPRPAPAGAAPTLAATVAAKKPAPKPRAPAPVQIAPVAPAPAPAPAASND